MAIYLKPDKYNSYPQFKTTKDLLIALSKDIKRAKKNGDISEYNRLRKEKREVHLCLAAL